MKTYEQQCQEADDAWTDGEFEPVRPVAFVRDSLTSVATPVRETEALKAYAALFK